MPRKTVAKVVTPAYDHDKAEKAVASLELIPTCGNFGFPTGSRYGNVRQEDNRAEYELFRPIRNLPKQQRDIIEACMNAYTRIGILRNYVDMMASFGSQGIQIVHPNKKKEKMYKAWFERVRGPERSERFLNCLYRGGAAVVKREMAKLTEADMKDLQKSFASLDADKRYERKPKPKRNEIPIDYTFLNPATIETAGGDLATFLGHPVYMLRIPNFIITMIKTPKGKTQEQLVRDLPDYIKNAVKAGEKFVTLDNDKLAVFHYMKDDWQQWATPISYSVLADLILYEKMKLADMAALDGAISHIRIWKLGSLEHNIQPSPAMFDKFQNMLLGNVGGGAMDLIWDAAIELQETGTDVASFLGAEKYEPVIDSINAGLGLPGSAKKGAGFTETAISLKTIIERLQYGRGLLNEFWKGEIAIVRDAISDDQSASVIYDNMSLYDEAAEKMLWFQLYDRHLCDDATIQEKFGLVPEVVEMRIKREEAQREKGSKPQKATPFHDPQFNHELSKIALQQGTVSPTEAGMTKKPKQAGDKSFLDIQTEQSNNDRKIQEKAAQQGAKQNEDIHQQNLKHKDAEHKMMLPVKKQALQQKLENKIPGVSGQGRPKNSKDKNGRKQRTPKLSSKADALDMFGIQSWAKNAQDVIAESVTKRYLSSASKKTMRSLTTAQADDLESMKFDTLCSLEPYSTNDEITAACVVDSLPTFPEAETIFEELIADEVNRLGERPPIEKQRDIRSAAYAIWVSSPNGV